jgi:glycosyltransferase involved in cell wall biosynthesis
MRIAQVCHRYPPYIGGVEEHVRSISERLAKKFEVSVFTTDPSARLPKVETIENVEIRRFRTWAPGDAYYFSWELRKHLRQSSQSFEIIHAHNYHALPALYAAQNKRHSKLVFTPHFHGAGGTFLRSLLNIPYRFLGKKTFSTADAIVCVSNYERALILKHFEIDEDRISVIPNGIDMEDYKIAPRVEKTGRTILYVGRIEKYKGVQYLVRALPQLGDDKILQIVGKGPYKEKLVKIARSLGVADRVHFFQDLSKRELFQKYAEADVFVLPSKYEAYGMTVAQALASGVPSIVARTSALREWVDNENCYGIDYEINVKVLVDLIEEVTGKKVSGVQLPTWDEVTRKLISVYERVASY